jgi:hypothetical protein
MSILFYEQSDQIPTVTLPDLYIFSYLTRSPAKLFCCPPLSVVKRLKRLHLAALVRLRAGIVAAAPKPRSSLTTSADADTPGLDPLPHSPVRVYQPRCALSATDSDIDVEPPLCQERSATGEG